MKRSNFQGIVFTLTCLFVLTLACQLPIAVQPTTTPEPTSTLTLTPTKTPVPTRTPTITPTPFPSLEKVVIFKEDLPKGFNIRPVDIEDEWGGLEVGGAFHFQGDQYFTDFIGWTLILPNRDSQRDFDMLINEPNLLADSFADKKGAEYKLIDKMNNLGEYSIGFTMPVSRERQWDVGLLRRGPVGVIMFVEYQTGLTPVIKVHEMAALIDQRIQEAIPETK